MAPSGGPFCAGEDCRLGLHGPHGKPGCTAKLCPPFSALLAELDADVLFWVRAYEDQRAMTEKLEAQVKAWEERAKAWKGRG